VKSGKEISSDGDSAEKVNSGMFLWTWPKSRQREYNHGRNEILGMRVKRNDLTSYRVLNAKCMVV